MSKFVITCRLPKVKESKSGNKGILCEAVTDHEGNIIYEENFFCGFIPHPNANVRLIEWDTDSFYALKFDSKAKAKQITKQIETGEPITIRLL
jgi:hypothetical protein